MPLRLSIIWMERRRCLDCEEIVVGRIDKKFCCDQCRNNYNNKQNRDANNFVRNLNGILRRNRRILQRLAANNKAKVSKHKLDSLGFNFGYFTNTYQAISGQTYYFCYEYGYLEIDSHNYMIVLKERYVQ